MHGGSGNEFIPLESDRLGEPTATAWRETVLARAAELNARTAAAALEMTDGERRAVLVSAVRGHLQMAVEAANQSGTLKWMHYGMRGGSVERANANLDAAEAALLRLGPDAYVCGQLPAIRTAMELHLPAGDPRHDEVETITRECEGDGAPLTGTNREKLVAAFLSAAAASRRELGRVRSFRNLLLGTALVLAVAAIGACIFGVTRPEDVPLCFTPQSMVVCPTNEDEVEQRRSTTTAFTQAQTPPQATRVPDDELREATSREDMPVVAGVGLMAAALAGAFSIRNMRGTSLPYGVPTAAAILKLPAGAVTAVLGILLMRGGFVPGLSDLDSSAQIIAWAVVFGYSQQLVTQFVDQRAESVIRNARSPTVITDDAQDPSRSGPAPPRRRGA